MIIYCIWNKKLGGYYGQDVNGTDTDFPRIKDHIDYIFYLVKDSAADLIRTAGIGGCFYGYWNSDDFFGIGDSIWRKFLQSYNLSDLPEVMKMHLAEICYIVANKDDAMEKTGLSNQNKAIGGGGLQLDFSTWEPIVELENSKWRTDLKGKDIDITFSKEGLVQISDLTDLIPKNNQEAPAWNKVLYAQKYACLRILTRIAPYYCLYQEYKDYPDVKGIIVQNLKLLIQRDKHDEGKKNIRSTFLDKFQVICDDLSAFMNNKLKQAGATFTVNLWKVFQDANSGQFVENMADYVATHITSGITNSIIEQYNPRGKNKKIINEIENKFFINRNQTKSKTASHTFKLAFRLGKQEILAATAQNETEPSWWKEALDICKGKRPTTLVPESYIKQIGFSHFQSALFQEIRNKPSYLTRDKINDVIEEDFLMFRVRNTYERIGFNNESTTITYWSEFFRAGASELFPGFEQIPPALPPITDSMLTADDKVLVQSPQGYRYEWDELWDVYNKWAGKNYLAIPLGWY